MKLITELILHSPDARMLVYYKHNFILLFEDFILNIRKKQNLKSQTDSNDFYDYI